jgi:hypothetical protein
MGVWRPEDGRESVIVALGVGGSAMPQPDTPSLLCLRSGADGLTDAGSPGMLPTRNTGDDSGLPHCSTEADEYPGFRDD